MTSNELGSDGQCVGLEECQSNYFPYFLPPALSCNGFLLVPKWFYVPCD